MDGAVAPDAQEERDKYAMKAERRHELRENDLLHALEGARDYINDNSGRLGAGLIALVALVAAVSFGVRSREAAHHDLWRRRAQLNFDDPDKGRQSLKDLAAMTGETSDSSFALSALLDQGRHALRLTQKVSFPPDRDLNDTARQAFEQLRGRFADNAVAIGSALLGLATIEENAFSLDHDLARKQKAKEYLDSVIGNSRLNGLPFQRMALDRLGNLDRTFSEVIYLPPAVPAIDPTSDEAAGAPVEPSEPH